MKADDIIFDEDGDMPLWYDDIPSDGWLIITEGMKEVEEPETAAELYKRLGRCF